MRSSVVQPGLVAEARAQVPDEATVAEMAAVFGLLGDASRLRLLAALRAAGELCVGDLAAAAGMSESGASHALRLLRAHGVVRARRDGRSMRYALRDGHVRTLLDTAFERSAAQRVPGQERSAAQRVPGQERSAAQRVPGQEHVGHGDG